jgi:P-type E1-E2 ATPase
VTLSADIPGRGRVELDHLLLDVNGTLADRGEPLEGVDARIEALRGRLDVLLLSADTFGTVDAVAGRLGVPVRRVATGAEKAELLGALGAGRCAAIGNGANDAAMLAAAALGLAVLGPEGASAAALASADVVCRSVLEALDLLLDERALVATLRA